MGTADVSDWFVGPGLETVMDGSLGTKLVTTTVVPWSTVMVAVDFVDDITDDCEMTPELCPI